MEKQMWVSCWKCRRTGDQGKSEPKSQVSALRDVDRGKDYDFAAGRSFLRWIEEVI